MTQTDLLKLSLIDAAQSQKHVPANETFTMIDHLLHLDVKEVFRNAPPGSPTGGDRYVVGGSPTGAWASMAYKIAAYIDGMWRFYDPRPGMSAYSEADSTRYDVDDTNAWVPQFAAGGLGSVTNAAFNKTADTTLANITGLTATLKPGQYSFSAYLPATCGAASGVKLALGGTALATKITADAKAWNALAIPGGARYNYAGAAAAPTGQLVAYTGVVTEIYVEGTITVTTAGTVTLRFAQNVSDAAASSILTDARLQFQRIT